MVERGSYLENLLSLVPPLVLAAIWIMFGVPAFPEVLDTGGIIHFSLDHQSPWLNVWCDNWAICGEAVLSTQ